MDTTLPGIDEVDRSSTNTDPTQARVGDTIIVYVYPNEALKDVTNSSNFGITINGTAIDASNTNATVSDTNYEPGM